MASMTPPIQSISGCDLVYATPYGASFHGMSETALSAAEMDAIRGKVQLIFTSPPFALNRKKRYGNLAGDEYVAWLSAFAEPLRDLLAPDGSIVLEMGNAWEPGTPTMSTLAIEALLAFKKAAKLNLCQEFVWHNTAKLPSPAQWVTVNRIRTKDSFTKLWWLSPVAFPQADNRGVLVPYSERMRRLQKRGRYNAGRRPSEHVISKDSFLADNGGAIPGSVIQAANTSNDTAYTQFCRELGVSPHPARMPPAVAAFFIKLCTMPGQLVFDPFAGSNTTGATAESIGRRWVSIEAEIDYARSGRARFTPQP